MVQFLKFTFDIKKKKRYRKSLNDFSPNLFEEEPCSLTRKKVPLQTSLQKNSSNSSYILRLYVNFENLTIELHVLIISFILAKFQKDQRLIAMLSMTCFNFKFLWLKIMDKKYIY